MDLQSFPNPVSEKIRWRLRPTRDLTELLLTNTLLVSRTEPDFVEAIGVRQSSLFQGVVTSEGRILAPVGGSFFFGDTRNGIVVEGFGIGTEYADRSISFVCQDYLCPGQRDVLRLSTDPDGDDTAFTLRDVWLVRTRAHVCHYAVEIHVTLSGLRVDESKSCLDDFVPDGVTDQVSD